MSLQGRDAMDITVRELLEDALANLHQLQPAPTKAVLIFINDDGNNLAGKLVASGVNNLDILGILEFQKGEILKRIWQTPEDHGEAWKQG